MRKTSIFLLILMLSIGFVSCELDDRNEMLTAGFEGSIVDYITGEIVPTDHTGNRAKLCFIDEAYGEDAQKIEYNILPEGTYYNSKVFPSTYTIYAKGPYVDMDTLYGVDLTSFKKFNLEVVPYLSISIVNQEVANGKMMLTYSYKLNTNDPEVKIKDVGLYYSKYPFPGNADVDNKSVFKLEKKPTDREGEITSEIFLVEGQVMYVRAGGTVDANSDYYNYSETIETPTEFPPAVEEKMDKSNWTVHNFSSEEPAEGEWSDYDYCGKVEAVFDGHLDSFWHTAWAESSPEYPHYFSINIGETKEVRSFELFRRQGKTDCATKIQLLVSDDGENWTDLGTFDFDNTTEAGQLFEVEPTQANYIKCVALEGPYNYTHLAEIDIYVSL